MRLNNGFEIPQIGVGTWTLRGETARQNVCLALKAGFRHVDTAQGYENEAEVGQGKAGCCRICPRRSWCSSSIVPAERLLRTLI